MGDRRRSTVYVRVTSAATRWLPYVKAGFRNIWISVSRCCGSAVAEVAEVRLMVLLLAIQVLISTLFAADLLLFEYNDTGRFSGAAYVVSVFFVSLGMETLFLWFAVRLESGWYLLLMCVLSVLPIMLPLLQEYYIKQQAGACPLQPPDSNVVSAGSPHAPPSPPSPLSPPLHPCSDGFEDHGLLSGHRGEFLGDGLFVVLIACHVLELLNARWVHLEYAWRMQHVIIRASDDSPSYALEAGTGSLWRAVMRRQGQSMDTAIAEVRAVVARWCDSNQKARCCPQEVHRATLRFAALCYLHACVAASLVLVYMHDLAKDHSAYVQARVAFVTSADALVLALSLGFHVSLHLLATRRELMTHRRAQQLLGAVLAAAAFLLLGWSSVAYAAILDHPTSAQDTSASQDVPGMTPPRDVLDDIIDVVLLSQISCAAVLTCVLLAFYVAMCAAHGPDDPHWAWLEHAIRLRTRTQLYTDKALSRYVRRPFSSYPAAVGEVETGDVDGGAPLSDDGAPSVAGELRGGEQTRHGLAAVSAGEFMRVRLMRRQGGLQHSHQRDAPQQAEAGPPGPQQVCFAASHMMPPPPLQLTHDASN